MDDWPSAAKWYESQPPFSACTYAGRWTKGDLLRRVPELSKIR